MAKKLKTYVIMVSRTYPAYHPRKGQPTYFIEKIQKGLNMLVQMPDYLLIDLEPKLHTFRANYPLWEKRIAEVLAGNAVIVLKYHSLGRYVKGNKQIEFVTLDKDSGVGVQEAIYQPNFEIQYDGMAIRCDDGKFRDFPFYMTAENDGLTHLDFSDWFRKGDYDLTESMACIHFTPFRYGRKS